ARRTLLTRVTEGRRYDSLGCGFQVSSLVDYYRILAAHFRDNPFDPELSLGGFCREFVYVQPDFLGSGECDEPCPRTAHEIVADSRSASREEVHPARRQRSLFEQLHESGGNDGTVA